MKHAAIAVAVLAALAALTAAGLSLTGRSLALDWTDLIDPATRQPTAIATTHATANFDVFYTDQCASYPADCIDATTVAEFGTVLEEIRTGELAHGFIEEPCDYFTFIADIAPYGLALGHVTTYDASAGQFVCAWQHTEFDRDLVTVTNTTESWRRNVGVHEFFHLLQYNYRTAAGWFDSQSWVIEGQAVTVSDKIFAVNDEAQEGYYLNAWYYLYNPSNLLESSYDAGLFWNYMAEQYGAVTTEPGRGMDALREYWEAVQALGGSGNDLEAFDLALDNLGSPTVTFEDVFQDFVVANYAKRLTGPSVPAAYSYVDETQPPGSYGDVYLRRNVDPIDGYVLSGQDAVDPWQPRYYRYRRQVQTSANMEIAVNQTTNEELFFALLVVRNGDLVDEQRATGTQFTRSLTGLDPADEIVLVVAGLDHSPTNPAKYTYFLSPGGTVAVNILSPSWSVPAQVGPIDAPSKFLTIVEVLQSGSPMRGLTASDFTTTVGGVSADVIIAAYVDGLYFLEVQAPVQAAYDANGEHLRVEAGGGSSLVNYAVQYADVGGAWPQLSTMVVVDRSGSMSSGDKIEAAKAAARLYVNSFGAGNEAGLVQYDDVVDLLQGLNDVDASRAALIGLIDQMTPRNRTAIGAALQTAQSELTANAAAGYQPHIFLLTDGRENEDPPMADVFWGEIYGTGTRVDVVAIGNNAQVSDLEQFANASGGDIFFAFDPASGTLTSDLGAIYRSVAEEVSHTQRLLATQAQRTGSWTVDEAVQLHGASEATVVFNYRAGSSLGKYASFALISPAGDTVPPTFTVDKPAAAGNEYYGHFLWRLANPMSGEYRLRVSASGDVEYFVEAGVRDGLSLTVHFGRVLDPTSTRIAARTTGTAVPILAFLSDRAPILGAEVTATITSGLDYDTFQTWTLTLHDDGSHGDGAANDGVYGNLFTQTAGLGATERLSEVNYSVTVEAQGTSNSGASFTREADGAFSVVRDPAGDRDGDRLPDRWERRHGLSSLGGSGDDGPGGDPDNDGLTNIQELALGTSPTSADTDRGGESDASESRNGRDPLNRSDDTVRPPRIRAKPGNGSVTILYGARSAHRSLDLYRSQTPVRGFRRIATGIDPDTGRHVDENVSNDSTYYYKLVGFADGGVAGGFSPTVSATPKVDPDRPWGTVSINEGAPSTDSTGVRLHLRAAGDVVEIRISNTPRFEDVSWQEFRATVPWTLAGQGNQSVFVQFRDAAGNVGGAPTDAFSGEPAEYAADSILVQSPRMFLNWIILILLLLIVLVVLIVVLSLRPAPAPAPG